MNFLYVSENVPSLVTGLFGRVHQPSFELLEWRNETATWAHLIASTSAFNGHSHMGNRVRSNGGYCVWLPMLYMDGIT